MFSEFPPSLLMTASQYQLLEHKTRRLISLVCFPSCSTCKTVCCNKAFCEESINSYWLSFIRHVVSCGGGQYDEVNGWLSPHGCQLPAGRPPVCYEFICNKILTAVSSKPFWDCFKSLTMLLTYAGEKALGNEHLITLSRRQIHTKIKLAKLEKRIVKAIDLYHEYEKTLFLFDEINLLYNGLRHDTGFTLVTHK
ncbi:MAG: hypothetical protein KQI62_20310 [Deltaproteobacteria bacterium]|nr:hypothetical protein [Deltaproteobacteria bacterium]